MPRKPRKIIKINQATIPDNLKLYFETGKVVDGETYMLTCSESKTRAEWERFNKEFLTDWLREYPCSRPWAWWKYDAPRWTRKFEGCFWDGQLPEPRRRLGGRGTPNFEVLAYVPAFNKGIPSGWVTQDQVDYYNGLSVDIHGKAIGTEYKKGDFKGVALDPENPPTFESEGMYLQRLNLLTPTEKKWLSNHQEALEDETVKE